MYGHRIGDQVLCFVASTLERLIDGEVGRIGGDEFVFYISDSTVIDNITEVLTEYLDIMQIGISLGDKGTRAVVTCSIGVVIVQCGGRERTSLIQKQRKSVASAVGRRMKLDS